MLTKKSWYLQVLQILYPYLSDQLAKLVLLPSDELAIDRLLVLLAEEEIIEKDFLEIKGKDMVAGDIDSIFYIVQLLNALVDRALDDGVD